MPLNSEFKSLCNRWKEKASKYDASDTHQLFDKYFSLYVVFNALYVETAAYLHRKDIDEKRDGYKLQEGSFPDKNAATQYVLNLLKAKSLMQSLEDNTETNLAIEEIKKLLTPQTHTISGYALIPFLENHKKMKTKSYCKHLAHQTLIIVQRRFLKSYIK